ncbi:MAG: ROK family protein [Actinomycetota bacterium]|nr:ROK family protein [Actinomycetota bacterium]
MSGPVIGVDIGGTKILAIRLGPGLPLQGPLGPGLPLQGPVGPGLPLRWVVEDEVKVSTPSHGPGLMDAVGDAVERLLPAGAGPAAIGIGAPGLVDDGGVLRFSPHLPGVVGTSLTGALVTRYPTASFWAGNDATAAVWAEHRLGSAIGVDDVVLVTLGTGIGGGIIVGGQLFDGANRFAGEFGHVVVDPHGPLCPCGRRGCWERFASGSGLGLLGREAAMAGQADRVAALAGGDPEAVRGEHVSIAAAEGDEAAVSIMGRFAWWVGLGLANLANIFDPELLVLGGGLIDAGDVLLTPTRIAFAELVEAGQLRHGPLIREAILGPRAGAVGAAVLAANG